jgi:hypothetical protein
MPRSPREGPSPREGQSVVPPSFPETPPPPGYTQSSDYSFLEIVMAMQGTIGKLNEAVESLKGQSKSHGDKLDQIGKDVHAGKVVVGVVGGLILLVCGFIAWLVNTYISTHPSGSATIH